MTKLFNGGLRLLCLLFLVGCGEVAVQEAENTQTANNNNANATLDYIRVTPGTSIIDTNAFLQLVATGGFSDNSSEDLTASVNWSVDNTSVASINDQGLLQGLTAGTVTVTASDGQYSDSAVVTVSTNAISPESISVTAPASVSNFQAGGSIQLDALGDFGVNGTSNMNNTVTWTVSDSSIASISNDGVLTALSPGVVTVTATSGSVSQSITITINAPQVTLDSILVTPANSSVDEGSTVQLMAVASYSDNTSANVNGSVSWSVSDASIATVNASGLITALAPGVVTVTASDGAVSNSVTVTVSAVTTNPPQTTFVSMAVTPATSSVVAGATVQLTATGTWSDNSTANINSVASWSVSDASVATVSNTGLVSTLSAGVTTVNVNYGAFSDSATIMVSAVPVVLQSLNVSAASNTAEVGDTVQLSAVGSYSDNSSANLTSSVSWSVSNPAIATIDSNGLLTTLSAGTVTVTATDGNISNATSVIVSDVPVTLQSIAITPANSAVEVGNTLQFTAIGTYSDNSTADITNLAGWSINVGIATIASGGLLTATGDGTVTVSAQRDGITSSVSLTINPASVTLQSIAVTPTSSTLEVGETVQLAATGTYSDNSTANISSTVTWSVSDTSIASISASGLLTATGDGAITVTASSGAISNTASVTIDPVPVTLQSIAVTPPTNTVQVGGTVQLAATGTYSDSSSTDLSSAVTWSVSDASIASINASGLLSTTSVGTVTVTATSGAISNTASVTIDPVPVTLQSIAVTPPTQTVQVGGAVQLTATATYSDSSSADISNTVAWSVSDPSIASINTSGLLTASAAGVVTVTATSGAISNTASVTIDPVPVTLQSIAVTPPTNTVQVGGTVQLAATGTYSDSSSTDLSSAVTWSVSDASIASISASGLLTAISDGAITVTASSGAVSNTASVTINPVPVTLQSIDVTPINSTVEVGNTVQLTATGTYSDSSSTNLSSTVNWSVSNPAIANIDAAGLLTTTADGVVTVTATSGAIGGNASVTINPVPVTLQSIAVTPTTSTVEVGETLQLAATGTYSDNSTADVSNSVSWSVNTGIASISSSGLLSTSSNGVVTITAALNGITGNASVTIDPVPVTLQSISVTPANVSINAGAAQQMTAIATYSDSSTADVTTSVVWTSGDGSIASISTAGVLSGGAVGTTNVSASLSGVTSNAIPVTITAPVAATLKLSEVTQGSFQYGYWFELYNPSTVAVDLGQYSIKSGNLTTPEALPTKLVPPGGYLVIMTQDLFDNYSYSISYEGTPNVVILEEQNFSWNSSGYIELLEGNETIDFVRFGSNTTNPTTASAWSGGAAPALSTNFDYHQSIARDTNHTDTDTASDWTVKDYSSIGGPNDITCITDADGDGIPDCSEVPGSTFAGMDLYAMGARVNQKDLFVEIDYMDPAGTADTDIDGMLPQREVLDKITAEFLANGFHVHFDVGDYFDQSAGLDPADYDLGGGDYVPFAEKIMFRFFGYPDGSHLDPAIADIFVYKAEHMALKRRPLFYYIVFAYSHTHGASGVSEVNGNDSFIALGSMTLNRDDAQRTNQLINVQSGTLMHEFGHALGLSHGGFEGTNNKPNYLSTMNYLYATNGIPVIGNNEGDRYYMRYNPGTDGNWDCKLNINSYTLVNGPFDDWTQFGLGFSDGSSIDLDEATGMTEAQGFGRPGSVGVDFNCDGDTDDVVTNFDINNDEDLEILQDYDDWGNIEFFFSQDLRHIQNGVSRDQVPSGKKVFVGKDWGKQPEIYAEPEIPNLNEIQEREYQRARQRATGRKAFEDSITELH